VFFQTDAGDVLNKLWMVVQFLAPIYAIAFGMLGARMLIEYGLGKLMDKFFPAKPKTTKTKSSTATSRRRRRASVYISSERNPQIRRTKTGVYVYYD
jgi:hypothetical protein